MPDPPPDYVSTDHIKRKDLKDSELSFPAYVEMLAAVGKDNEPRAALKYVEEGMLISYEACTTWLEGMSEKTYDNRYAEEQFVAIGVLATGVLGIVGVDSDVFSGLALGTAFAMASVELYQYYKLLGKDSEAITDLVKRSMDEATEYVLSNPPRSFYGAVRSLTSFSELCKPTNVRNLVLKSLNAAKPVVSPAVSKASESASDAYRIEIAQKLGEDTPLTAAQFLGVYWLSGNGTETTEHEVVALKLLGRLKDAYEGAEKEEINALVASIPYHIKDRLSADVSAQIAKLNETKNTIAEKNQELAAELALAQKAPEDLEQNIPSLPSYSPTTGIFSDLGVLAQHEDTETTQQQYQNRIAELVGPIVSGGNLSLDFADTASIDAEYTFDIYKYDPIAVGKVLETETESYSFSVNLR